MGYSAAAIAVSAYMSSESANDAADMQADAANKASQKQEDAMNRALAMQEKQYADTIKRQEPWYAAGKDALTRLQKGIAPGGEFSKSFSGITDDPSYKFRFNEGQRALEASAAARGQLFTAGQMDALQARGQDMASQEYNAAYNRFAAERAYQLNNVSGLAGVGINTASNLQNAGQNYASMGSNTLAQGTNQITGYLTDAASAQAAGKLASTNAWTSAIGSLAGTYSGKYTG